MGTPRTGPWLKVFLGGLAAGAALLAVMAFAMVSTDQRPFCASCHIMPYTLMNAASMGSR